MTKLNCFIGRHHVAPNVYKEHDRVVQELKEENKELQRLDNLVMVDLLYELGAIQEVDYSTDVATVIRGLVKNHNHNAFRANELFFENERLKAQMFTTEEKEIIYDEVRLALRRMTEDDGEHEQPELLERYESVLRKL